MKPIVLLSATAMAFGLAGTTTFAARGTDFGLQAPATVAPPSTFDLARHGADDGAGHDLGDDKGGKGRGKGRGADDGRMARNGADDGPGHDAGDDHGGRGDDGGRGRGRGGDDGSRRGDDDGNSRGRHGGRERVPGGSGCDSAGDIAEHAGCGG